MIAEDMLQLGQKSSVIREIFEYGNKRKREIGADKVFDFSLGNPSVPAPTEPNTAKVFPVSLSPKDSSSFSFEK